MKQCGKTKKKERERERESGKGSQVRLRNEASGRDACLYFRPPRDRCPWKAAFEGAFFAEILLLRACAGKVGEMLAIPFAVIIVKCGHCCFYSYTVSYFPRKVRQFCKS